jgi:hypothetical protein
MRGEYPGIPKLTLKWLERGYLLLVSEFLSAAERLLRSIFIKEIPSMSINVRSLSPNWRQENPCGFWSVHICRTAPLSFNFFIARSQSSSLTLAVGFPRKTPVFGSNSQRDNAPLKLIGTFSSIITNTQHLRDIRQQSFH